MAVLVKATQTAFRFRNDDGSETSATWKAAANTNISVVAGTKLRIRFATSVVTGSGETNLFQRCVLFSSNGGSTFQGVTTSSGAIALTSSTNVADESATTQQITTGGTFRAGNILTATENTTVTDGAGDIIEDEACILASTAGTYIVQMGDYSGGSLSNYAGGYNVTATLTVTAAATTRKRRRTGAGFF